MGPKKPCHSLRPPQPLEGEFCPSSFLEAQSSCTEVVGLCWPFHKAEPASWELGLGNICFRVIISWAQKLQRNIPPWNIPCFRNTKDSWGSNTFKRRCANTPICCVASKTRNVFKVSSPTRIRRKREKYKALNSACPFLLLPGGNFYGATPVSHHWIHLLPRQMPRSALKSKWILVHKISSSLWHLTATHE